MLSQLVNRADAPAVGVLCAGLHLRGEVGALRGGRAGAPSVAVRGLFGAVGRRAVGRAGRRGGLCAVGAAGEHAVFGEGKPFGKGSSLLYGIGYFRHTGRRAELLAVSLAGGGVGKRGAGITEFGARNSYGEVRRELFIVLIYSHSREFEGACLHGYTRYGAVAPQRKALGQRAVVIEVIEHIARAC